VKKGRNHAIDKPKKRTMNRVEMAKMLVNSAKKNEAKVTAECSVKKPATNSDSASGRSKGALFVSATALMANKIANGKRGKMR